MSLSKNDLSLRRRSDPRLTRSVHRRDCWASRISTLVDAASRQAHIYPDLTLLGLARDALDKCLEDAKTQRYETGDVPSFGTVLPMIRTGVQSTKQEDGSRHVTCGRPMGEVLVGCGVIQIAIPKLGADHFYLLMAQDIYSGLILAAAVSVLTPSGETVERLLYARTVASASVFLGAIRLCMGIPSVLVLEDNSLTVNPGIKRFAAKIGVDLVVAPPNVRGNFWLSGTSSPQGWLSARHTSVNTPEGLMTAIQEWLLFRDLSPSKKDLRSSLDRWHEGVALYGIRLSPIVLPLTSTNPEPDDGTNGSDSLDP